MKIAPGVLVHHGFWVQAPWRLSIGVNSVVGDHAILDARGGLSIGANVLLSSQVAIWTGQHDWQSPEFGYVSGPVEIGDHAWLSFRCVLLPGVTIGEGAVVAAGALVTKSVPPYALVGGVPAKVIGERSRDLQYQLGYGDGNFTRFL
ncbi:MAG TPA: acyltransferase [Terracidiphilus sp.]|nr:acyltransferase [Terracidiphilus sp.]